MIYRVDARTRRASVSAAPQQTASAGRAHQGRLGHKARRTASPAWEVSGVADLPPADFLTCGFLNPLPVNDRDCPRLLVRARHVAGTDLLIRREWADYQVTVVASDSVAQPWTSVSCCRQLDQLRSR